MTVYSVGNGDYGRVYDADGVQIEGMIIQCDTETGEVLRYRPDGEGCPQLCPGVDRVWTETVAYKKPLRFERRDDREITDEPQ